MATIKPATDLILLGLTITALTAGTIFYWDKETAQSPFAPCVVQLDATKEISPNDWQCIAQMYDYEIKKMPKGKFVVELQGQDFMEETVAELNRQIRTREATEYKLAAKTDPTQNITRERFTLARENYLRQAEGLDPEELFNIFEATIIK